MSPPHWFNRPAKPRRGARTRRELTTGLVSIIPITATNRRREPEPRGEKAISQSERDWAFVREGLRRGRDADELRRELEQRRQDKPSPRYYARRTVDRAVASLEGRSR